jgi:predicted ArsR family transcriptional regulator
VITQKTCNNRSEMKRTKLDKRFFGSTRGRIVTSVRGGAKTVNDLAEELELTDNAVRAHLLSLERDGLIRQGGLQRGTRKPHFSYELTSEAESLFPKAYDVLLNQLIAALKGCLTPRVLKEVLSEVGRSLAHALAQGRASGSLETRAARGLTALEALGGAARIETEGEKVFIRGGNCPLAVAVSEHPEVCQLAETLLTEIVGARVHERCDRTGPPRCSFEVTRR